MAAPSGTVWGSIVNNHGRIGIYTSVSSTATQTTVNVQAWFWTWYSCTDSYNTLYLDIGTGVTAASTNVGSTEINHTRDWGEAWHTDNQTCIYNKTFTYTRGTSATTYKVYAKYADIDYIGASMYANTSFTVPALTSYMVSYNANEGSGAPSAQTKWYGKTLTLSGTKPTRTGYSFQGWATSASGGVSYASGASYTANSAVTLYAVWKANTYTVSYNANGGSGAPATQTKTYGVTLTLSSTKPTRTNYNFLGWGTSASATNATYAAGGNYTANSAVTLYAVWELAYVIPTIHHVSASRCDSSGNTKDDGLYCLVRFEWSCTHQVSSISISWASASSGSGTASVAASGKSGEVSQIVGDGELSVEASYSLVIRVADSYGYSSAATTLNGMVFAIDYKSGGKGVSFGKPAELDNTADFAFDAKFNGDVYGKAMGMGGVTLIPDNSDFNDYTTPGCYAVSTNNGAFTCDNVPFGLGAGRLEVWSTTGQTFSSASLWAYLRQRYIPLNYTGSVYARSIQRLGSYTWVYGEWINESLSAYPVNSVYISCDSTSPASIYGGTWEQLKDRFLLGAGSTYTNGSTGGASTHTLVANEMPSHDHMIAGSQQSSSAPSFAAYINAPHVNTRVNAWYATTSKAGGGAAHNNMPPYLVVYIWRRTA